MKIAISLYYVTFGVLMDRPVFQCKFSIRGKTCKAKRQQSCRVRSTPIDNTYHLNVLYTRRSWKIWTIWRSATHAISQHHYRDMHCTKWSRAHQSPSNLFSCPESGLKFAYFAIKFFQLFFTVQWWQSGIALRKANWIYIVIKEKKNNLIEQPHVSYLTRLPLSHSWHPMSIVRPSLENVN